MTTAYLPNPEDETAPRLADARPLYIASGADTLVRLDGPALCVSREERPEQYFPLQRLCRVHSSDQIQWTTEALLACARRGIGVLFMDDDGTVTARLLGRPGERDELYHRLMEFLLLPQSMGMYQHWLNEHDGRTAWWAGSKLGIPVHARDPRRCRESIQRLARRYAGPEGAERSGQWLRAIAYSWMQGHLQDHGFGTDNELGRSGEPALARDLTRLFMWYLEPPRIGWLKRRCLAATRKGEPLRAPGQQDLVRLFESRAVRAAARGRAITSALHRWLIHET
jgi:hypothetical protein